MPNFNKKCAVGNRLKGHAFSAASKASPEQIYKAGSLQNSPISRSSSSDSSPPQRAEVRLQSTSINTKTKKSNRRTKLDFDKRDDDSDEFTYSENRLNQQLYNHPVLLSTPQQPPLNFVDIVSPPASRTPELNGSLLSTPGSHNSQIISSPPILQDELETFKPQLMLFEEWCDKENKTTESLNTLEVQYRRYVTGILTQLEKKTKNKSLQNQILRIKQFFLQKPQTPSPLASKSSASPQSSSRSSLSSARKNTRSVTPTIDTQSTPSSSRATTPKILQSEDCVIRIRNLLFPEEMTPIDLCEVETKDTPFDGFFEAWLSDKEEYTQNNKDETWVLEPAITEYINKLDENFNSQELPKNLLGKVKQLINQLIEALKEENTDTVKTIANKMGRQINKILTLKNRTLFTHKNKHCTCTTANQAQSNREAQFWPNDPKIITALENATAINGLKISPAQKIMEFDESIGYSGGEPSTHLRLDNYQSIFTTPNAGGHGFPLSDDKYQEYIKKSSTPDHTNYQTRLLLCKDELSLFDYFNTNRH